MLLSCFIHLVEIQHDIAVLEPFTYNFFKWEWLILFIIYESIIYNFLL